jgi:hypothetical protein
MKESSRIYIKKIHDDRGDQTSWALDPLVRLDRR